VSSVEYDQTVGVLWVGIAVAILVAVVAFARRSSAGSGTDDIDVGSVSEGWLSEQRGKKGD
jgi:hypothetical protein